VELIERAARAYLAGAEASLQEVAVELQVPRKAEHGDWASNVALKLAKSLGRPPMEVAQGIRDHVEPNELLEPVEVAPPGFINLRLNAAWLRRTIQTVLAAGEAYGRSQAHEGERALVEFVSANPTGPLHVGHGRNAVVGDTLARLYAAVGFRVEREYYYNDAGVQMGLLGESLRARYLQQLGRPAQIPDDGYQGEYLIRIAERLAAEAGEAQADGAPTAYFTEYAAQAIMADIRRDLETLDIRFDRFSLESSLHAAGRVSQTLDRLRQRGMLYEHEGALWLKTTDYGDEKDRVVRKKDGETTYLAPDIAYHEEKFARGYDRLVNVWGGDHHGYVARLKAAIAGLGEDPSRLHCVLIQMVGVRESGTARKLSTRSGDFVPLAEILKEFGPDLARYFFLSRAADSQMVFDLDLARSQSMDNPYFYLQYAHARCCSLLRKAEAQGFEPGAGAVTAPLELIQAPEERAIVVLIGRFPAVVLEAAEGDEPLTVTLFLRDLATAFHAYFTAGNRDTALRCVQPERPDLTAARLALILALRQTLANGMALLGLRPMERL